MSWSSIPPSIPRWLQRYPLALAAAIIVVNRLGRFARSRRAVAAIVATAVLGGLLATLLISDGRAAMALQQALAFAGILVAVCALYAASLVSRHKRKIEVARAQSWLVATPRVATASSAATARSILLALLWRLGVVVAFAFLLSFNRAVGLDQSLQLSSLITSGAAVGALVGWLLSRRSDKRRHEGSRYTLLLKRAQDARPSNDALAHWPIAQAFAWGRPENARLLLLAAIVTVPAGIGLLGALFVLATWLIGSYLIALVIALPHAARSASKWLRSTPITFWAFAWPLARRALLHQLCGTLLAIGAMLMLGASPLAAIYAGALWLTLVVMVAALTLADCYRARAPTAKAIVSILAALLTEERAHGWGISLAVVLAALHLRMGASHERA